MTPARAPSPGYWMNALLHPVPLGMLALLLANDHVLKVNHPGWVSGKLSDVAGLALLPFVLLALADLAATASPHIPAPGRRAAAACVLATAAIFTAMQITPLGADVYRWTLAAGQWPFHAMALSLQGGPIPTLHPVQLTPDPSDLLTLPAAAVALLFITRRSRSSPMAAPDKEGDTIAGSGSAFEAETLTGTTTHGVRLEVRGCDLWTFRKDSFWKIVEPPMDR